MKRKSIFIIILLVLILIIGFISVKIYNIYRIKNAKIEIVLSDDLTLEFLTEKKVSDFIKSINGTIVDDYEIDSTVVGTKKIEFKFINDDNIKLNYSFDIEIVDKTPPLIWLSGTYSVSKGSSIKLEDKILCGDNYDNTPNCYIEGEYDLNKVGKYPLVFNAIDSSNNKSIKKFTLNVYDPKESPNNPVVRDRVLFSDVIKNYKTSNTKIGLDISAWQNDVDYKKLKNSGVEFVILRIGRTQGINGSPYMDDKFIQNIKRANEEGIDVGIYYYSFANTKEKAREEANWVLEQIKDYKVTLPIAFDWEEWSNYNEYKLSFFNLTNTALEFMNTIEDAGYKSMLYSSKTYLENMWLEKDYDVWLAHYTNKTDYKGDYIFWQMCNTGKVDGINGNVDIDIMYIN